MLIIAHRASPTTFDSLVAQGANVVELDVRVHGGGAVVTHYLPFLRIDGWIEHDGRRFRRYRRQPTDPLLHEALAALPPSCEALLDLKEQTRRPRRDLADVLSALGPLGRKVYVSGPHPADLDVLRQAGLRTWRTIGNEQTLRSTLTARHFDHSAVTVRHTLLTEHLVSSLHEVAPRVIAWTVNDVRRARELHAWGVDGVTTDSSAVMTALQGPT